MEKLFDDRAAVSTNSTATSNAIKVLFDGLARTLDQRRAALLSTVKKYSDIKLTRLDTQYSSLEEHREAMLQAVTRIERLLEEGEEASSVDFLTEKRSVCEEIDLHEQLILTVVEDSSGASLAASRLAFSGDASLEHPLSELGTLNDCRKNSGSPTSSAHKVVVTADEDPYLGVPLRFEGSPSDAPQQLMRFDETAVPVTVVEEGDYCCPRAVPAEADYCCPRAVLRQAQQSPNGDDPAACYDRPRASPQKFEEDDDDEGIYSVPRSILPMSPAAPPSSPPQQPPVPPPRPPKPRPSPRLRRSTGAELKRGGSPALPPPIYVTSSGTEPSPESMYDVPPPRPPRSFSEDGEYIHMNRVDRSLLGRSTPPPSIPARSPVPQARRVCFSVSEDRGDGDRDGQDSGGEDYEPVDFDPVPTKPMSPSSPPPIPPDHPATLKPVPHPRSRAKTHSSKRFTTSFCPDLPPVSNGGDSSKRRSFTLPSSSSPTSLWNDPPSPGASPPGASPPGASPPGASLSGASLPGPEVTGVEFIEPVLVIRAEDLSMPSRLETVYPCGVCCMHESDNLLVTDVFNHCVRVLASSGRFLKTIGREGRSGGEFKEPCGIAVTADNHIFVTERDNQRVQCFTPTGKYVHKFGHKLLFNSQLADPWGVAAAPDGKIYVSDWDRSQISVYQSTGKHVKTFGRNLNIEFPAGVALDRQGRLLVVDRRSHCVWVLSPEGEPVERLGQRGVAPGELYLPYGIATRQDGSIIVTESGNHRVSIFASTGQFVICFGRHGSAPGEFDHPRHVCVNSQGHIIVADEMNQRVQVFQF